MEIYGQAVDADTSLPLPGATCQRLYPDGQNYSAPTVADGNGIFYGAVPDRSYGWLITSVGYEDTKFMGFAASVVDSGMIQTPQVVVRLKKKYDLLDAVVVTPGKSNVALYVGLFVAAVAFAKYKKMI